MTRPTRDWFRADPNGIEHPLSDADEAMHPLVGAALAVIVFVLCVCAVTWFATLPTGDGELAPVPGTTTTEGQP